LERAPRDDVHVNTGHRNDLALVLERADDAHDRIIRQGMKAVRG
jgi:hypothetical protein